MSLILSRIEKSLLFVGLLLLLGVAISKVISYDVFWQLQAGKYMAESCTFIHQDIFSLASEAPRWEHCWLHDLAFYGAYLLLGYSGVSLLKGGLVFATALALIAAARLRGASWSAVLPVSLPAVFLTYWFWLERPQLWTYLFFALFILVLERDRSTPDRMIWFLPPLMVVWSNLHGGAMLAFPILAVYLVASVVDSASKTISSGGSPLRLLWVLIGVALAMTVTPYGLEPYRMLLKVTGLGVSSGETTQILNLDWQPLSFRKWPQFFYAAGTTALFLLLGRRRISLRDLLLLGGLFVMAVKLERHGPFFLLGVAAILPSYVEAAVSGLFVGQSRDRCRTALCSCLVLSAVILMVVTSREPLRRYGFFNAGLRSWHYPVQAAAFVEKHRLPGNLFNSYEAGGYLMWALFPKYRVFFDGRQSSSSMFEQGMRITWGTRDWQSILNRHDVCTVVLVPAAIDTGKLFPIVEKLRESPDWTAVFVDEGGLVFVRSNAVDTVWLLEHQKTDRAVDDAILAHLELMIDEEPRRPLAYWEMTRIHMARRNYPEAFAALEQYMSRTPRPQWNPAAEVYYRVLTPMMRGAQAGQHRQAG